MCFSNGCCASASPASLVGPSGKPPPKWWIDSPTPFCHAGQPIGISWWTASLHLTSAQVFYRSELARPGGGSPQRPIFSPQESRPWSCTASISSVLLAWKLASKVASSCAINELWKLHKDEEEWGFLLLDASNASNASFLS
jgi:hypothetical protein